MGSSRSELPRLDHGKRRRIGSTLAGRKSRIATTLATLAGNGQILPLYIQLGGLHESACLSGRSGEAGDEAQGDDR
jgi:hypothetical protein